ncbi:MAG: hypothetical protein AB8G96_09950 [Phycisphaerales bacterium]
MRRSLWFMTVIAPIVFAALGTHLAVCTWGIDTVGRPLIAIERPAPPGGFVRNSWTGILLRQGRDGGGAGDQAIGAIAGIALPLGLLALTATLVDRRIRADRVSEGRCAGCGFTLDLDGSGRCPECGALVDARRPRH